MGITGEAKKKATAEAVKRYRDKKKGITPGITHPNMPDVVREHFLKEWGYLPSVTLGTMTEEQYERIHCMSCGGFYLIGTRQCPKCDRKPLDERLRALAGHTTAKGVKG